MEKDLIIGRQVQSFIGTNKEKLDEILTNSQSNFTFETSLENTNGDALPLNCSVSVVVDNFEENQGFLIIAKDVSEEKNQEQQLLNAIISTEEKERKRLAYDIHDSLGQELNAVQMYLSSLTHMSTDKNEFKETFEQCKAMLDQSIATARDLSFDLMPKSLEDGNLNFAIAQLTNKLGKMVSINYNCESEVEIKKEKQVIIYRIIQEFINNSMKYALPCEITIQIKKEQQGYCFFLSDNGSGFDMDIVKLGNGIQNVKSRLKALNANYKYSSKPNVGTKLEFKLNDGND